MWSHTLPESQELATFSLLIVEQPNMEFWEGIISPVIIDPHEDTGEE